MDFEKMANPSLTREECRLLVLSLDSYIRRLTRDYNHDVREGVKEARLQVRQAKIEAAKELREKMAEQIKETYAWRGI